MAHQFLRIRDSEGNGRGLSWPEKVLLDTLRMELLHYQAGDNLKIFSFPVLQDQPSESFEFNGTCVTRTAQE